MAYLVLDLDLTTFIANLVGRDEDNESIDPHHTLTPINAVGTLLNGQAQANLRLINACELSNLIEQACTQHDGLIILTSGLWDPSIRHILAEYLDLSEKAANLLRHCYFHSPLTDQPLHLLPLQEIKMMPKSDRLQKIISHRPELRGKRFVTLDDDEDHTASFKTMYNQTTPVLATPHLPDKSYYQQAEDGLKQSSRKEKRVLHPNNSHNGKIKVRLFDGKRPREGEKENTPVKRMRMGQQ